MSYLNTNFNTLVKLAKEKDEKKKKKKKTSDDTRFTAGQLLPSGQAAFVAGRSPEEQNIAAVNGLKIAGGGLLGGLAGAGLGIGGAALLNHKLGLKSWGSDADTKKVNMMIGGIAGSLLGSGVGRAATYKTMMKNRGLDPDMSLRHHLSRSARAEALLGGDEEDQRTAFKRAVPRFVANSLLTSGTGGIGLVVPPLTARLQRTFVDNADHE